MKKISTILALLCAILMPQVMRGQTITIDSLPGTTFCTGDPISVTFTVTGTWLHRNAFTLQLSNDSGNFAHDFQNLGSITDTAPGTFNLISTVPTGVIYRRFQIKQSYSSHDTVVWRHDTMGYPPHDSLHQAILILRDTIYDTIQPTHYRVRIMGALPYTVSADNGTDLVLGITPTHFAFAPYPGMGWGTGKEAGLGVPKSFTVGPLHEVNDLRSDTMFWSFGDGASPATASYGTSSNGEIKNVQTTTTTYSTPGLKIVTVTIMSQSGCSVTDTQLIYVHDCTSPVVPHDAIVISNDTSLAAWDCDSLGNIDSSKLRSRTFWVNPGVTVSERQVVVGDAIVDTIFAEAGATVKGGSGNIVYLKQGASALVDYNGIVIYADGASVLPNDAESSPSLQCSSLSFDYSHAPPNSIMHITGVVQNNSVAIPNIDLSPNPTTEMITVDGVPANATVQVMNVLGNAVQSVSKSVDTKLSLDLSSLAAGTYYVRFASNGSVITKKVVKE